MRRAGGSRNGNRREPGQSLAGFRCRAVPRKTGEHSIPVVHFHSKDDGSLSATAGVCFFSYDLVGHNRLQPWTSKPFCVNCASTASRTFLFFGWGLLLPANTSKSALRERPLPFISSGTGILFNAGSTFVCHSSRRSSGYSVYTLCSEWIRPQSTASRLLDSLPMYLMKSIWTWRRRNKPAVCLPHTSPFSSAHFASG